MPDPVTTSKPIELPPEQTGRSSALPFPLKWLLLSGTLYSLILSLTISGWSLWTDEAFSAYIACHKTLGSLMATLAGGDSSDLQTAIYYLYLHGWTLLFGSSEIALRTANLPFLALFAFALPWIGWRVFRSQWLWVVAATLPFLWSFAAQVRTYFALITFSTVCLGCLLAYLEEPSERERRALPWILLGSLWIGSGFDMLMLLAVPPMIGLLAVWRRGPVLQFIWWADWKRPLQAFALPFLILFSYVAWTFGRGTAYDYARPSLLSMASVIYRFVGLLGYGPNRRYDTPFRPYLVGMAVSALALLMAIAWTARVGLRSNKRIRFLAVTSAVVVGVFEAAMLSIVSRNQIELRHLAALVPFVLVWPLAGLAGSFKQRSAKLAWAAALLLTAVWSVADFRLLFLPEYKEEDFRSAVAKAVAVHWELGAEIALVGDPAAGAYYGLDLQGPPPCFPLVDDCLAGFRKVDWRKKAPGVYATGWTRKEIVGWLQGVAARGRPAVVIISRGRHPSVSESAWWPILRSIPRATVYPVHGFSLFLIRPEPGALSFRRGPPWMDSRSHPRLVQVVQTTQRALSDKSESDSEGPGRTPLCSQWSSPMNFSKSVRCTPCLAVGLGIFVSIFPACSQGFSDPGTSATFGQAIQGMSQIENYEFGTGPGKNVMNLQQLAGSFNPYGIAGTTVINQEWERYQPFNTQNFVFTPNALNLTATIPQGGGLFPGGIHSGQIWTKQMYTPERTGYTVYAFEIRMRIPSGPGMWPASWFYAQHWGESDGSEIDNPEFFNMKWQNQFDWTGFQHGPGQGADLYSIKTNQWVWHPQLDFSADYHDYQTFWTPDAVYKYVDGTLIYADSFKWTAAGAAQFGANLAVGSSETQNLPGLQPTSLSQFPSALSIDHISIWAK